MYNIKEDEDDDKIINALVDVERAEMLYESMKYEADKYTRLAKLANDDYKKTVITNIISQREFTCNHQNAHLYLEGKKDEDGSYKASYDAIVQAIEKLLDITSIDLINISQGGLEGYSYIYTFKVYDRKYELTIPCQSNINTNNIAIANYAKLSLSLDKGYWYEVLVKTYSKTKLKEAFKKNFFETIHEPRFEISHINEMIENNTFAGSDEEKEIRMMLSNKLYPDDYINKLQKLSLWT
jgi:hypothetical protein